MAQKTYKCRECGKRVKVGAYDGELRLEEHKLCFTCNYWINYVILEADQPNDRIPLRAKGSHYVAVMDNSAGGFKGFGGARFIFEHVDGRVIFCNNVWHQGNIPDTFKERLPDNGRFLSNDEARLRGLIGPNSANISTFV